MELDSRLKHLPKCSNIRFPSYVTKVFVYLPFQTFFVTERPKPVTSRMAVWVERLTGVPCMPQNHSGSTPLLVRKRSCDVSGLQGFNQKQRNVMPYLSRSTHQSKKHHCWENIGKTSQEQVQIRGLSVQESRVGPCQRTWSWLRLQAGRLWRMWQGNCAGRAHWSFEVLS